MKRLVKATAASLVALTLAACGTTPVQDKGGNESQENSEISKATSGEKITLTLWDIWPEGQPLYPVINEFIEKYQAEHENIVIDRVSTQEVDYQKTKLRVAAADGSQGDIFSSWGGGYAKTFVDAGVVLNLDEYFKNNKVDDELLKGATTYSTYNGSNYGLPLKQWAGVLYCNQDIFDANGVKIPETYEDMLAAVTAFKEKNITPMVLGAKDGWHIGMIQNALAVRTAGADYMNQALAGEASLNSPEIVKSAQLLVDLNKAGAFPKGTLGLSSDEAEEEFYSGAVPMFFGGSWVAQSIDNKENAVSQNKVVTVPMPVVKDGKGDASQYSGGVIDFLMVNAKTKHPAESFDFALQLTKYLSAEAYKIGDSLPCWKNIDVDKTKISPTLVKIEEMIQNSTGYVLAWDTFLEGSAIDEHYNLLQGLIEGTITPEQFAEKMQAAQEASKKN